MKDIKKYHFNEQTDSDRRSVLKSAIGVAFTSGRNVLFEWRQG